MMYINLTDPDARPQAKRKILLPDVSDPEKMTPAELETLGVAECDVIREPTDWWQMQGETVRDDSVRPVRYAYTAIDRPIDDVRAAALERIKQARFRKEDEGVTVNGVRYSGSQANRQTLDEAVRAAQRAGQTEFLRWKDSDNVFHPNHPVADVEQALDLIAQNRGTLIATEGEKAEIIMKAQSVAHVVEAAGWE